MNQTPHAGRIAAAIAAGAGIGVLPCFLGDRLKGVKRVMGIPVAAPVDIWIVTHAALRQNPVVTALMRTLADGMRRDAAQLLAQTAAVAEHPSDAG